MYNSGSGFQIGDTVLVGDKVIKGHTIDGVSINQTMEKLKGRHLRIVGIRPSKNYWTLYDFKFAECMFWFPRAALSKSTQILKIKDKVITRDGRKGLVMDNRIQLENGIIIGTENYSGYYHKNIRAFDIISASSAL